MATGLLEQPEIGEKPDGTAAVERPETPSKEAGDPYPFCAADSITDETLRQLGKERDEAQAKLDTINSRIKEVREAENFIH